MTTNESESDAMASNASIYFSNASAGSGAGAGPGFKYSFLNMSMLMFLSGVCGNVIALIILFRTRSGEHSKTVFQILIKALVLNDVTFIIMTSIPPQLAYANGMTWQGGAVACHYHASAMLCAGLTTPFLITIMSIERAICLSWWQFYVQHMTKRRAVLTVFAAIAFAAAFSLLPVVGIGRTSLQARGSWCFLDLRSTRTIDKAYSFVYASFLTASIIVSLTANLYVIVTLLRYRKIRKDIVRVPSSKKTRQASMPETKNLLNGGDRQGDAENQPQGVRSLSLPAVTPVVFRPSVTLSLSANCRKHSKSLLRVHYVNETKMHVAISPSRQQETTLAKSSSAAASTSHRLKDLELQMIVLLFVLTVVFTVCWTPLTAQIFLSVFEAHNDKFLLAVRMASFNQLIDPWCYVVLRIGAVVRIVSQLRRSFEDCLHPQLTDYSHYESRRSASSRLLRAILRKVRRDYRSESTCDCMCDCPCHLRNACSA